MLSSMRGFLKVMDNVKGFRLSSELLREYLSDDEIKQLVSTGMLIRELKIKEKERIKRNGREYRVSKIDMENDKVLLSDLQEPGVRRWESLDKFIEYKINYEVLVQEVVKHILEELGESTWNIKQIEKVDDYVKSTVEIRGRPFVIIFQFKYRFNIPKLLIDLAKNVELRRPVLMIISSKDLERTADFINLIAVGALANFITYTELSELYDAKRGIKSREKILNDLKSWFDYVYYVLDLENKILSRMEEEKYSQIRKLLVKVDTNPKYLVTMLFLFKTISRAGIEKAWQLFEDLASLSLVYIYGGGFLEFGYRRPGENLPDSIFIVRYSRERPEEGKIDLIGIVDVKSGDLRLSPEDVTKYLEYFNIMRRNPLITNQFVVLYFITRLSCKDIQRKFDVGKENRGLYGFYQKISRELDANEYIAILPVDSLILLIDTYLSALRRLGIGASKSGIEETFRLAIRPTTSKVQIKLADKLYCIDKEKLKDFFANKLGEDYIKHEFIA
ncbi:MAG: hypothetical protein ACTSXX_12410 [Candidatus Baldrarchaeia archaeon]